MSETDIITIMTVILINDIVLVSMLFIALKLQFFPELKGEKGDQGPAGETGPPGPPGIKVK